MGLCFCLTNSGFKGDVTPFFAVHFYKRDVKYGSHGSVNQIPDGDHTNLICFYPQVISDKQMLG